MRQKLIGGGAEGKVYRVDTCLVRKVWTERTRNAWTNDTLKRLKQLARYWKTLPVAVRSQCTVPEFVVYEYDTDTGRLITYHEYIKAKPKLQPKDEDLLDLLNEYFVDVSSKNVLFKASVAYLVDVVPRKYAREE